MPPEVHRLHPLSWLFITATSIKGLILPVILAIFAFGGGLMLRLELLSVIFVVPTLIGALIRQAIYNYRFGEDEMVAYEFAKVRFLYEAQLKLSDRCAIEWFVGPHMINGVGTFEFLHHHLKWPER